MKKSQNPNARVRRRPVLIFIIIILLTIAALGASIYLSRRPFHKETNSSQSADTSSTSKEDPTQDEHTEEDAEENVLDENLDNPIQYEGEDPNKSEVITGVITTARVSGNTALIHVNIDQYLASGSCTINLVSNVNKTYSETVKIGVAASTSTCEGFNIPVSSLGSGTWAINISVSSGDKQGNIIGELTI